MVPVLQMVSSFIIRKKGKVERCSGDSIQTEEFHSMGRDEPRAGTGGLRTLAFLDIEDVQGRKLSDLFRGGGSSRSMTQQCSSMT